MPQPTAKSTRGINTTQQHPTMMGFIQALSNVFNGGVATRESWDNPNLHIKMHKGQLCVRLEDGLNHPLIVTQEDIEGEDWLMVPQSMPVIPGGMLPIQQKMGIAPQPAQTREIAKEQLDSRDMPMKE